MQVKNKLIAKSCFSLVYLKIRVLMQKLTKTAPKVHLAELLIFMQ